MSLLFHVPTIPCLYCLKPSLLHHSILFPFHHSKTSMSPKPPCLQNLHVSKTTLYQIINIGQRKLHSVKELPTVVLCQGTDCQGINHVKERTVKEWSLNNITKQRVSGINTVLYHRFEGVSLYSPTVLTHTTLVNDGSACTWLHYESF